MNFMHIGIDDSIMVNLKPAGKLPEELAIGIDNILMQLGQVKAIRNVEISKKSRNAVLTKLIRLGMSHQPTDFAEYQWYAAFSVAWLLLKQCPNTILSSRITLLSHVFATPVSQWDMDVQKIHTVAEEIYKISSNASDVVYVVTNISTNNNFTLFVGISLLWAAFCELVGQETDFFHLFSLHELTQLVENNLKGNDLTRDGELQNIHDFLSLYSVYQDLVLIREINTDEFQCFADCFIVDHEDLLAIHEFLMLSKTRLEALIRKQESINECIRMVELLQHDILSSLEPLLAVNPMAASMRIMLKF